ncbi:MAG: DUF2066 domain-containing protein [Gammaproteobacteria bacterium]|nr:DUF2066 domain-containing protein [Gammaproteobacteria bacterium]
MRWIKIIQTGMLGLLLWAGLAGNLWAARAEGVYEAQIPVKSMEQSERLEGYTQGLRQVVVKVTGDRRAVDNPVVAEMMKRASQWVLQYRYRDLPDVQAAALKAASFNRMLVVEFDGGAVTSALAKANLPLWGRTRPQFLLWLAVDERTNRYLAGANSGLEVEYYVNNAAWMRGLPVILPLQDLEDQSKLRFADVWGDFQQSIVDASARYGADGILVGRLNRLDSGAWQGRWSSYQRGETLRWSNQGGSAAEVVTAGIDAVADNVGRRMAQVSDPGAGRQLRVTVNDVNSLAGYARVRRYLESLDAVEKVYVEQVTYDSLVMALDMRADGAVLRQVIALGSTLAAIDAAAGAANDERMIFRLLP